MITLLLLFQFLFFRKFTQLKMARSWNKLPAEILEMIFEVYKNKEGNQKELFNMKSSVKAGKQLLNNLLSRILY